jgi:hypothetical protein
MRGTVNTFYRGSNPLNAYPLVCLHTEAVVECEK